ncbi:guanylyl cyclase 1 isoform X2 [Beta vulgaris subsp. vulgaris]|uniref:guanylyl cyclase 1 isoform X2 n=1 Tax=Beta vulgaris subsp. vulgaris TaxID=3555 RepID=UPI00053FD92A|nr:guanylyl cyclase 1 isoform X2 [Beta vulgaris subsp. vulgaris]
MRSFCVFVNKILNLEEARQKTSDCDLSDSCLLKFSSTDIIDHDVVLPRLRFIEVPHVKQLSNWDCGLACVLMVLQTIGINNCSLHALEDLCDTRSIWTVDLAYLLQSFSVVFSYFTVTLGANPNFSVESFYKLPHDLDRVDMLFQKSIEAGIRIECRSFSQEEVSLSILSGRYIAIVLVDQCKLSQLWLEDIHVSDFCGSNLGYTGHYVVICGYDTDKDEFEIRDPASARKYQKISSKHLDEARKSFGTDEDLLLISLDQRYKNDEFPLIPADHVNED